MTDRSEGMLSQLTVAMRRRAWVLSFIVIFLFMNSRWHAEFIRNQKPFEVDVCLLFLTSNNLGFMESDPFESASVG